MKKILIFTVLLSAMIFRITGDDTKEKNPLALQLPPAIYATPGVESNIYFDNIVLTINSDNYVFDVECKKGYNDAKRWRYVPKPEDIGEYPWHVQVYNNENKMIGRGETKVIVSPRNAGKGKNISILIIGDSLTNASVYARRINTLFKVGDNPTLKFIGSHSGGGKPAGKDGVCHEGYGGWSWLTFCGMWSDRKDYRARSKFLTMKNGKKQLDFKAYLDKYNQGKSPDFITIMLGTNDVFAQNDTTIDTAIKSIFKYMDMFLKELSTVAPQAKIGVALTPPPARSQDAFGANYKCGQTRWQFKRNQHRLVQAMIKKFASNKNKNISLIPTYVNLDCENGFPVWNEALVYGDKRKVKRQRNGVHPSTRGYNQIGDSIYCWMKYQLTTTKK